MRKEKTITIGDSGRDRGKMFHLIEMSATRADKWARRAIGVLIKSGVDIPDDALGSGLAGLAAIGIGALANVGTFEADAILDELMDCVKIVPDPNHPGVMRPLIEDDIEEVKTLYFIRAELFELHTGFSIPGLWSKVLEKTTARVSANIQMSAEPSAPSSHQAKRR